MSQNDLSLLDDSDSQVVTLSGIPPEKELESIKSDLNDRHNKLVDMMEVVATSIITMSQLSEASQHPKTYETLAKLVMSYSSLNKETVNTLRHKHEIVNDIHGRNNKNNPVLGNIPNGSTVSINTITMNNTTDSDVGKQGRSVDQLLDLVDVSRKEKK